MARATQLTRQSAIAERKEFGEGVGRFGEWYPGVILLFSAWKNICRSILKDLLKRLALNLISTLRTTF
ncbi:hypothetical protein ACTXT7_013162 [Hymenolepis weldensis]